MKFIQSIVLILGISCAFSFAASAQSTAAVETTTQEVVSAKTIKVKVKGVGCSRDLQAISTNVAKVNGVSICETLKKGATTTFSVTFNPSVTDEQKIHDAVEDTPGCSNQVARPYKVKL